MKKHERLRKKLEELSEGDLETNKDLYKETVDAYIKACNADDEVATYDFSELIFPDISFVGKEYKLLADFKYAKFSNRVEFGKLMFSQGADFTDARFSGDADFSEAQFLRTADFSSASFMGDADFRESRFSCSPDFRSVEFSEDVIFRSTEFLKGADFDRSKYRGSADFRSTKYSQSVSFSEAEFLEGASFISASFKSNAIFENTKFLGSAYFIEVSYSGEVIFRSAEFMESADFRKTVFNNAANFRLARFSGSSNFENTSYSDTAYFKTVEFSQEANFKSAKFSGDADFRSAKFFGDADFRSAEFFGDAFFTSVLFGRRFYLNKCVFHDELHFNQTKFSFIKHPPSSAGQKEYKSISLEGAILEAAHLWGIDTLHEYIFKDALILGVSLAGKSLVNCDFTGAVMKRVFTDGWKLDATTINNTKYIYTDYEVIERSDEEGNVKKVYVSLEASRVPAGGYFGDESNQGFTIKEYFHRPYEWNYALDLPAEMRTTILNALQFFREYAEKAKNEQVDINTRTEGSKLRVIFQVESEEDKARVENIFREYVEKLFSIKEFVVEFENPSLEEYKKAELQRRTAFLQKSTLLETAHQMQLSQGVKEKFEGFLLPILQAEDRIMDYSVKLLEKASQIGAKEITSISNAEAQSESSATATSINTTSLNIYILGLLKELENVKKIEGLTELVEGFQTELRDIREEAKLGQEEKAKNRWKAAYEGFKEFLDLGGKTVKIFELIEKINKLFEAVPPPPY